MKENIIINYIQCYRELVEYKRIEIDKQSVFELIQEQLNNLLRRGEKPTKAILGYDAMQELKVELYEDMRFSIELPYHEPGQLKKVLGLEIILSPYINGVILI